MSFADFVRLFWGEGRPHPRNRQRNHVPGVNLRDINVQPEANMDIPHDFDRPRIRRAPMIFPRPNVNANHNNGNNNNNNHADIQHPLRARVLNRHVRMRHEVVDQPWNMPPPPPALREENLIANGNSGVIDVLNIESPKAKHDADRNFSINSNDDLSMNSPRESLGCDVPILTARSEDVYHTATEQEDNLPAIAATAAAAMDMSLEQRGPHKRYQEDWSLESENSWSTVTSESEHMAYQERVSSHHESEEEDHPKLPPADPSLGIRRRAGKLSMDRLDKLEESSTPLTSLGIDNSLMREAIAQPSVMEPEPAPVPIEDHVSDVEDVWEDIAEDEDWMVDLDDNNGVDPVGADVEVRFALDELLGLRGPHFTIVKHVIWFLTFTGLYLFVFVFFPVSMGSIIVEVFAKHFPIMGQSLRLLLPRIVVDILVRAQRLSVEKKTALCLSDLALTIVGYFTIYTITTCWHHIMSFVRKTMISSLDIYVKFLDNLVIAGKIGLLLSVRIFLLPVTLGKLRDDHTFTIISNALYWYRLDDSYLYERDFPVHCRSDRGLLSRYIGRLSDLRLDDWNHLHAHHHTLSPTTSRGKRIQSIEKKYLMHE
jgi:hypothetical protein